MASWESLVCTRESMYTREYGAPTRMKLLPGGAVNYLTLKWGDGRLGEWWAFARESTVFLIFRAQRCKKLK